MNRPNSVDKLKQMFKMMSLRTDAGPESLPPITYGSMVDCLLHVRPHLDQTLFQLIHVTYGLSGTCVPEHSPKSYNRTC